MLLYVTPVAETVYVASMGVSVEKSLFASSVTEFARPNRIKWLSLTAPSFPTVYGLGG